MYMYIGVLAHSGFICLQTEAEIVELEASIANLRQALADKTAPQMVVNTRLENR